MKIQQFGMMLAATLWLAVSPYGEQDGSAVKPIPRPEASVMPNLSTSVDPQYPEEAIKQSIGGKVVLNVIINKEGMVTSAVPISGDPIFQEASLRAVKQWRFRPYILNNEHIDVETTITLEFKPDPPRVVAPRPSTLPRMLRVSQGVMEANILRKVSPLYPEAAKAKHIQGDVLLRVRIDREGNVSDLKVESKPSLLDDAAIDAVKQWKYKPMTIDGEPVLVETTIKIRFKL